MKIRLGFVSNSSSCSFVILGSVLDTSQKGFNQIMYSNLNEYERKNFDEVLSEMYKDSTIADLTSEEFIEICYESDVTLYKGSEGGMSSETEVAVGTLIVDGDDELESNVITITQDMVGKQIITGTRMC